jgi:hypothetical protein
MPGSGRGNRAAPPGVRKGRSGAGLPAARRGTLPAMERATDQGRTKPAGDSVSDEEMVRQVADQTSSDLIAEDAFEQEADGTRSDTEAAKGGAPDPQR